MFCNVYFSVTLNSPRYCFYKLADGEIQIIHRWHVKIILELISLHDPLFIFDYNVTMFWHIYFIDHLLLLPSPSSPPPPVRRDAD